MTSACSHLDHIKLTASDTRVCEDCVKTGDVWVQLRMCLECGHVGCCDASKNRHATKHSQTSHHPLMRSIEPHQNWVWCYVDEIYPGEIRSGKFIPAKD